MRRRARFWLLVLGALVALGTLAYANRLVLLQHSLGWLTDLRNPRGPNQGVPWQAGPDQAALPPQQRPPNVVIILADDLGINDVSAHGPGLADLGVPTPHIDSLARAGVRFDNGYAAAAVCTVSRAALLTGRYPWRFGLEFTPTPGPMARVAGALYDDPRNLHPVLIDQALARQARPFNELGMPGSELTLAEVLKTRGYHTLHIGKWHLGSTPAMRPNAQGFDETLFMESGLYLPEDHPQVVNSRQDFDPIDRFLWPNMRWAVSYNGGAWFEPRGYLTDYFTDEAVAAIGRNRHRPFLLYLAHWGVHTPLQAAKADYDALGHIGEHRLRVYAAMVRSLDRSVGRVLAALRDAGLEHNTLVVFSSDNGAPNYIGLPHANRPYRGWKLTHFEGGLRVPFLAQWPAAVAPGTRLAAPVQHIDILPTVAAAAGATLPAGHTLDGVNLLPQLASPAAGAVSRALHWRDGPHRAVQEGGWKLIRSERPRREWLFHLAVDPTEQHELGAREPAQARRLRGLMDRHHEGMPPPLWPSFIELPVLIDKTLDQPQSPQDEYTYWVN